MVDRRRPVGCISLNELFISFQPQTRVTPEDKHVLVHLHLHLHLDFFFWAARVRVPNLGKARLPHAIADTVSSRDCILLAP